MIAYGAKEFQPPRIMTLVTRRSEPTSRCVYRKLDFGVDDAVTIAAIEAGVPSLIEARALVDRFHTMVRTKNNADLDTWIDEAKTSLVASFVTGIAKDKAAVNAAITEPWSNGQGEAQITKLTLVKRQMYGRAKIDLLQARLLGAA